MIYCGGCNTHFQLSISLESDQNNKFLYKLADNSIDTFNIRNIIIGKLFTIIVTRNGSIFGAGIDSSSQTENPSDFTEKTYKRFSKIEDEVIWAATGKNHSLYLTKQGKVLLHGAIMRGNSIEISLQKRALSVFGGVNFGGVIDVDGGAYFIDYSFALKNPTRLRFSDPAFELVCCIEFKAILLTDLRVYGNGKLNNNQDVFTQVTSLAGHRIVKISGFYDSCLALSEDGLVFAYGSNNYGQLGNGTRTDNYEGFRQVSFPYCVKIKDISCCWHSLFLSMDGKLYGCGCNKHNQLFIDSSGEDVLNITKIETPRKISKVFACFYQSFIISDANLPDNPSKVKHIEKFQINSLYSIIAQQNEKIMELENQIHREHEETKRFAKEEISRYQEQVKSLIDLIADFGLNIISNK